MCRDLSIYFSLDVELLDWPESYKGSLVKEYFLSMMKEGAESYVKNGISELALIKLGSKIIPLTINETQYSNSYVTSIYAYLEYAKGEMIRHNKKVLSIFMKPVLKMLSFWFKKAFINRTVIVNNVLLSTNIYDPISDEEVELIHRYLLKRFPLHSIIFRSLNNRTEKSLIKMMKKLSYQLIMTRSIYFFDPNCVLSHKKRWINAKDKKLFTQKGITLVQHEDFTEADVSRIKQLYDMLYLEKYSFLNPQFSKIFFCRAIKNKSFTIHGIRLFGKLVAVIGYFTQNKIMTTPIVGYDTSLPNSLGLYRMLTALVINQSMESKHLFHMSSGVGHFKRQRGASQEIESMAVYVDHLSLFRRLPWKFLKCIFNKIARPLIIKHKL